MNSNHLTRRINLFQKLCVALALVSLFTLVGCGGGSASTTSTVDTESNLPSPVAGGIKGEVLEPANPGSGPLLPSELDLLPQIFVGQRQFADPNVMLNLRGTVTAAAGATVVKTLWTQVTGPQVSIPSPLALENLVLMPDVNIATQLEFRLTAEDSAGRVNSATVSILIKPVPTFVKVIGGVFNENDEMAVFKVRLNAPGTLPITISYVTVDGSAKSETDYFRTSGEVVLAVGETTKDIPVLLANDAVEESDESFSLQVTAIDGQETHANSGVVIIHNGVEPQLKQSIQFASHSAASVFVGSKQLMGLNREVIPLGTGDIIYSSSNPLVASVNSQGEVTALAAGTTEISVTKLADNIYLSASDSYVLNVLDRRGAYPVVQIEQNNAVSVQQGDMLHLSGYASDQEDGFLPTQAQIDSGIILSSLRWQSNINGTLGFGPTLDTNILSPGTHEILYAVTDSDNNTGIASITALVGNIAPLAKGSASSTFCGSDCYSPDKINDSDLSTKLGPLHSWVNGDQTEPRWVALNWSTPATINTVDLYTSEGYALTAYEIEYWDGANSWLPLVAVTGNTELHRSHAVSQVTTDQLRVVTHGSDLQPTYGRVNELVVFGTVVRSGTDPVPSSSAGSSSVPSSSRAAANSSSALSSSLVPNSSSVASSKAISSSVASSKALSSSVVSSSAMPISSTAPSSSVAPSSIAKSSSSASSLKGSIPLVKINSNSSSFQSCLSFSTVCAVSVQLGQGLSLLGSATDTEDGVLPTTSQVSQSLASGKPITSLSWSSNLDGFLGYGETLNTLSLTQGTHLITYSVADSDGNVVTANFTVLVGNIAPLASTEATSTDIGTGYSLAKINDSDLSTQLGGVHSWVNAQGEPAVTGSPRWTIYLTWGTAVTINAIDLYTSDEKRVNSLTGINSLLALRGYNVEYWNGVSWLPLVSVTGNTLLHRSHVFTQITTNKLRVVTDGSEAQYTYSRVNELVVFGATPNEG